MQTNIHKYLYDVDCAVRSMEHEGVYVDSQFCDLKAAEAREQELAILARLPAEVMGGPTNDVDERNGESGKKLVKWLHEDLKLPKAKFWRKGQVGADEYKVDATALSWIAGRPETTEEYRKILNDILGLRRERACIKYLAKLPKFVNPKTGRVHCSFGAASEEDDRFGAVTGRLACKLPELQQIPKDKRKDKYRIRKAFTPQKDSDVILALDYKALEVVMLAHYGASLFSDDSLVKVVTPGAPDLHSINAVRVYELLGYGERLSGVADWLQRPENLVEGLKNHPDPWMRRIRDDIKAIWYGLQYGKTEYGFGNTLVDEHGVHIGEDRAGQLIEALLEACPLVRKYQNFIREFIVEHRGIGSWQGRWRDLSFWIPGKEWQVNSAWRKALNHPMQAGGAEVIGFAMGAAYKNEELKKLGFKMVLQVHDELLFEGPRKNAVDALNVGVQIMTGVQGLRAPLTVSGTYGESWDECK